MTKAPFSLHCIICFEAFHLVDRPPVVLPCGHTYVCLVCSKRLKRCMECREPLFLPKPVAPISLNRPNQPPGSPSLRPRVEVFSRYSPRYSPRPYSPTPSSPCNNHHHHAEPIPLPVPKNLVLMSLMEAAERTSMESTFEDKEYESGDDDDLVLDGMDLLSSGYGTYVVREQAGLLVYPQQEEPLPLQELEFPHHQFGRSSPLEISYSVSDSDDDDQDEAVVQEEDEEEKDEKKDSSNVTCEADKLGNIESAFRKVTPNNSIETPVLSTPMLRLQQGQTIQVVSFINGVAVLSRGRGFVLASNTQLVKVGDSGDKTSKIEGMLVSMRLQKQALAKKLAEIEKVETKLLQDLEEAKQLDEDEEDIFGVAGLKLDDDEEDTIKMQTPSRSSHLKTLPHSPSTPTVTPSSVDSTSPVTPGLTTPDLEDHRQVRHVEFSRNDASLREGIAMPSSMDAIEFSRNDAALRQDIPTSMDHAYMLDGLSRAVAAPEDPPSPITSSIGPLLFCGSFNNFTSRAQPVEELPRSTPASPSHSAVGGGDRGPVDFRTGFSGHLALSSANTHADRTRRSRGVRLMSETMGISSIRRVRRENGQQQPRSHDLSNPTW